MGKAWNDWYHVTVHTYGSWLRGDPRGWRARHHREHVDGDYRNPPPKGTYDKLLVYSKSLMPRDPVRIATDLRRFVLDAVVEKLLSDGIEVIVASLDGNHLHVLARFRAEPITSRSHQVNTYQTHPHQIRVPRPSSLWELEVSLLEVPTPPSGLAQANR